MFAGGERLPGVREVLDIGGTDQYRVHVRTRAQLLPALDGGGIQLLAEQVTRRLSP